MNNLVQYRIASQIDLEQIWNMNIADNLGDKRWISWKAKVIMDNKSRKACTFVVIYDDKPIGEGTLIFSPECGAINGRMILANNKSVANINALRIRKEYEGKGYISTLVRMMERYAIQNSYTQLTIGVEAKEARNLAIYLHWGYDIFVTSEIEDGELVLYYAKNLDI